MKTKTNPNWFINGQEAIKILENFRYGTHGDRYKTLTYSIELIRGLIDKNSSTAIIPTQKDQSYKIIGRNSRTNRQDKKRIYTSEKDFMKYKDDLINRYKNCYGIAEVYKLIDGKWFVIETHKK